MPETTDFLFPVVVLGVWTLLAWFGWQRSGALEGRRLRRAPDRRCGINAVDLIGIVGLLLLCSALAVRYAAQQWGPLGDDWTLVEPWVVLKTIATVQWGGQGVVVVYLLMRTALATQGWGRFGLGGVLRLKNWSFFLGGVLLILPAVMLLNLLVVFGYHLAGIPLDTMAHKLLPVITQAQESGDTQLLAGLLLSVVVTAPLLEEIIFRGGIQTGLLWIFARDRRWLVILLAAGVFMVVHASVNVYAWPGLFLLAVMLGWLYERTGSLWPAIGVHAVFNAANVGMALLSNPVN